MNSSKKHTESTGRFLFDVILTVVVSLALMTSFVMIRQYRQCRQHLGDENYMYQMMIQRALEKGMSDQEIWSDLYQKQAAHEEYVYKVLKSRAELERAGDEAMRKYNKGFKERIQWYKDHTHMTRDEIKKQHAREEYIRKIQKTRALLNSK